MISAVCIFFFLVGQIQAGVYIPFEKPGQCPVTRGITPCVCIPENSECRFDSNCPGAMKCCDFGCGCNKRCVPPVPSPLQCYYNGQYYPIGAHFPSVDGCNTCYCNDDGTVMCTLKACGYGYK
uniref:PVFP-6 n=1 Tax=Perna viridis TaxID=73031 RepID=U5Y6V3_PERVI